MGEVEAKLKSAWQYRWTERDEGVDNGWDAHFGEAKSAEAMGRGGRQGHWESGGQASQATRTAQGTLYSLALAPGQSRARPRQALTAPYSRCGW